ncbi:Rh166 [macacine betaherpesvirus 3]|nr:Rh166 [macacine betaherpesvirus 3]
MSSEDTELYALLAVIVICTILTILGIVYICYYPREAKAAIMDMLTCACVVSCYRYGCDCQKFRTLTSLNSGELFTIGGWITDRFRRWWHGNAPPTDPVQYYSPPREGDNNEGLVPEVQNVQPVDTVVTIEGNQPVTRVVSKQPLLTQAVAPQTPAQTHEEIQECLEVAISSATLE